MDWLSFSEAEINAIMLSLKVASVAMLASLPFAIGIAWLLVYKKFYGKALLNSLIHLPLVLPPVVVGYLLLITMGRNGFIGKYLWQWFKFSFGFSWYGATLACSIVAFPLLVRSIRLAMEQIDYKLLQAGETLGASQWRIFFTLTLPLSSSGILAGVVLGFARSLGEFGATITFVSNIPDVTQTIPLAMYSLIETPNQELAAGRLCLIAIIIALLSLVISEYLSQRSLRKIRA